MNVILLERLFFEKFKFDINDENLMNRKKCELSFVVIVSGINAFRTCYGIDIINIKRDMFWILIQLAISTDMIDECISDDTNLHFILPICYGQLILFVPYYNVYAENLWYQIQFTNKRIIISFHISNTVVGIRNYVYSQLVIELYSNDSKTHSL